METDVKKEIWLAATQILLGLALFASFVLNAAAPSHPAVILLVILLLLAWVSALSLTLALVTPTFIWISLLSTAGIYLVFTRAQIWSIAATLIFLVLVLAARRNITRELHSRIKFNPRLVFYPGLKYLLMAVVILFIGFAVPYLTRSLAAQEDVIPESLVRVLLKPYQPYLPQLLPVSSIDTTVEEMADRQITSQTGGENIPSQQRQSFIQQFTQQLSESLNQDVSSNDDIASIITNLINSKIHLFSVANPLITPIIIIAIALIATRIIISILAIPAVLFVYLIIHLARKTSLIKLNTISQPVEVLEL